MPIAISPEQRALQASIREWANQAGTIALVRRLEPGEAPRVELRVTGQPGEAADSAGHWEALADLGIFSIALPPAVGGADGTVADLAAALEELTHALVPGPVMPTLLAGLLLRGQADHPAAKELLPALASGQASAAVGLATGMLTGTRLADGTLRVSGETGPVLGAGATSHLLLGAAIENAGDSETWFLIPAGHEGIEVVPGRPVDFSRSLARIRLTSAVVTPDDILTGLTTQELNRAGVSRPDLVIGGWAGPAIIRYSTPAQRERFVRPTLRGEITWCQLFSEPDAGSDLAAVRTRAVRAEGGWQLTGQKVWTSLAHEADWAICLARTDPEAPKHCGLTYFLVDMHSGGIEIRPLREITGRAAFNEVFLDGVFVPGDSVVGECGDGWRIARSTLATERVAMGRGSALGDEVERLIDAVASTGLAGDPAVQEQVGALVTSGLAGSLMDLRSAMARLAGADEGHHAAVRKLVGVAHRQAVAETALTLCGPDSAASDGPAADAVYGFLLSRCLSIAGGTSQILLNVVAERALGLPREESR